MGLTTRYAELHCHSSYSFLDGASSIEEMAARAAELGYPALALTDHDNLCGAMEFARTCGGLGVRPVIGAEVTLQGGHHLTLLVETSEGYANLCRLLSVAHVFSERRHPRIDPEVFATHARGLIALSGCRSGRLASLVTEGRIREAKEIARQFREWFGPDGYFVELQQNLVHGDTERNVRLVGLARDLDLGVVATNNAHYHRRDRRRLQDCLVAIRQRGSLEETHRERRANSEFFMKSPEQMAYLFKDCPEAIANTLVIAERCAFDLGRDLSYRFPSYPVPEGETPLSHLQALCRQAAVRRYGRVTERARTRMAEEFRLIAKHDLAGFFLIYPDIIQLAREVQMDLGLVDREVPIEEAPPGRGRGSSVAMLVGYLIGLSHIDPLQYDLPLERFLQEDMGAVPDIDLDFPRDIREELITRVHRKYGWDHAALTGMVSTYNLRGAVRDLGRALGLPADDVAKLAKRAEHWGADDLRDEMLALPDFRDKVDAPVWRDLIDLSAQLDGLPKYLAQHPGGMIISSTPLIDQVPIQRGAIDGRYVCHWDKDSIDDAGFVKIDFLALGALSQMQDTLRLVEERTGRSPDLSRIDFEDAAVYDMLCRADTIGIFQVESAAQMQTISRIRPRNLLDMAHEVAAVRPGVGANAGVSQYIRRRQGLASWDFDHPLEERALGRTFGIILFQDQVNQLAIDVAGFSARDADLLRRAFTRRHGQPLIAEYWKQFREGAATKGVDDETALRIFKKFNGHYMFPEAHAVAFGVTAYQMSWLKHYHPLEFTVAIFNQQPMGFYSLETLKEDARHHGITVLNPDVSRSRERCTIEGDALLLGLRGVAAVGPTVAEAIVRARDDGGPFGSVADFMERTGAPQAALESLAEAGAFDALVPDRRAARWEIGLRYRPPAKGQLALPLGVTQDMARLPRLTAWERMAGEYRSMELHPGGHLMSHLREWLGPGVATSQEVLGIGDGVQVRVAGVIIRRQKPLGKAVFMTLEDEHGHTPLVVWPAVYARLRHILREPVVVVTGTVSRREGTMNIVVRAAVALPVPSPVPPSKDWG